MHVLIEAHHPIRIEDLKHRRFCINNAGSAYFVSLLLTVRFGLEKVERNEFCSRGLLEFARDYQDVCSLVQIINLGDAFGNSRREDFETALETERFADRVFGSRRYGCGRRRLQRFDCEPVSNSFQHVLLISIHVLQGRPENSFRLLISLRSCQQRVLQSSAIS
jgi:hypothetical protein